MKRSLRGAKCFITGAASGIGRATALGAARRGARLFLTDVQQAALDDTVREIVAQGGVVEAHRALDIRDYEAVSAFAQAIHASHGAMDVVMNIAGISIWGTVDCLQHEHWRKVIDVNLMGPIHVIECFVPTMMKSGNGGHLVNVASAAGLFGLPWHAAYSASKFGLRGISEVLRFDLERYGIDVSLVCPGAVDTPLVGTIQVIGVDMQTPRAQRMRKRFQRHAITPERAAEAILRGVERKQYMVYTSNDIRVGFFFQRIFSFGYEQVMRIMSRQLHRFKVKSLADAGASSGAPSPGTRANAQTSSQSDVPPEVRP